MLSTATEGNGFYLCRLSLFVLLHLLDGWSLSHRVDRQVPHAAAIPRWQSGQSKHLVFLSVRVELHSIADRYTYCSEPFVGGLVCIVPEWTGSAFPTRSPNLVPTGSE